MIYKKDKINRIIDFKDSLSDESIREDIEWLIGCYNDYYADSREYEQKRDDYSNILNKYYNAEDEKANLKELLAIMKRKYKTLKELYNSSCKNKKTMI